MAVYRPKYRHPSTGELIEVANLVVRVLIRGEALSRIHLACGIGAARPGRHGVVRDAHCPIEPTM